MTESGVNPPVSVFRFRLTCVDALAYERLPGEWSGKAKAAFILPLVAIGVFAGFIEDWRPLWWWLSVCGLVVAWAAIGIAVYNWRIHRRARTMAARQGRTEIEEWGDHLAIRSEAGEQFVAYELIGKVIVTEAHVFILYHGGPVIVPLRAFEDVAAMRTFGAVIDRRSAEAAP